jgi:hypothetical protein
VDVSGLGSFGSGVRANRILNMDDEAAAFIRALQSAP